MKTQFVIFCDRRIHQSADPVIRTFVVSSLPNSDQIGLHPLGKDVEGNLIDVLLVDDQPVQRNFSDERMNKFVQQKRTRIRHNFECGCGFKVELSQKLFLDKIKKSFNDGVSRISLTSLNK